MTTLDDVTKKNAEQSAEQQAAVELVRLAQEQGLSLTGPDGLLKQLTKTVIETALQEEMTEHLGYEKHDPVGAGTGNIRNGTRANTVLTETSGQVEIEAVKAWAKDLHRHLAAATVADIVSLLSTLLNEAVEDRRIPANSCRGLRLMKRRHTQRPVADPEQVLRIALRARH